MRRLIKSALQRFGFDLVRHRDLPERPLELLEYVVHFHQSRSPALNFVQIGANDGVRQDPIREIVLKYKLPGLLVEPIPDFFDRLQANYAGTPGLAFERCAIGATDGTTTMYRIRPDPSLPDWVQGLATFDRAHLSAAKFNIPHLESFIEQVEVPVLTLPSLLAKHGITSLYLLQIDTEGYDCQIVTSALKSGLRPTVINYEFVHTSIAEQADCKRMLMDCGYRFLDVGQDTLAIHDAAGV